MNHLRILLSIIVLAQSTVVNSHTWVPDPQRGAALQARWKDYKSILFKNEAAVEQVCRELGPAKCWKPFSRPTDEESESCDRFCCHDGYLTGFCHGGVSAGIIAKTQSPHGQVEYRPAIDGFSNCICTNEQRDATCGPDGSFLGIRCPFDKSACQRKCCRKGKSGGHCGGFLSLKCKCD